MEIELRDWQKEAYEEFKTKNYQGILKVGTGKGKTIFAIYVIKQFLEKTRDFKVCIIVPTMNLMEQWKKQLIKFLEIDESEIGLYYGQEKDPSKRIVIFVVNSAVKNDNLKNIHKKNPFAFLIADECHHYGAMLFSKIFECKTKYKLGLSATPAREKDLEGNAKIFEGLGPIVYELNHLDDPEAIPPFDIWSIKVELTSEERNKYEENSFEILKLNNFFSAKYDINPEDDDYDKKIKKLADQGIPAAKKLISLWGKQASIKYRAENKILAIKEIIEMEKEEKIIVFNERIDFAERIYKSLEQENLNLSLIHSNLSRKQVIDTLERFRKAEKGVLIAPKLIDEGYDVPDASIAIIASFTNSARQTIQRDGRILRKTPEKRYARRYSLVVEGLEENKYYGVLKKAEVGSKALEGLWLKFDCQTNTFSEDSDFKDSFINFDKVKEDNKNQFEEWVLRRLDYYESNLNFNYSYIQDIERRIDFFSRFRDVVDRLIERYPRRWGNIEARWKNKPEYDSYTNKFSGEENEDLVGGKDLREAKKESEDDEYNKQEMKKKINKLENDTEWQIGRIQILEGLMKKNRRDKETVERLKEHKKELQNIQEEIDNLMNDFERNRLVK